jgi:hypothetical protein
MQHNDNDASWALFLPCTFNPEPEKEEEQMEKIQEHNAIIFSNQRGLSARICPRGSVAVCIGHTCISLRKSDFLDLAEIIMATQQHVLAGECVEHGQTKH